jgi:hypothetical protein
MPRKVTTRGTTIHAPFRVFHYVDPLVLGAIHKGCPSRGGFGKSGQTRTWGGGGGGGGGFSNPDVRNLKKFKNKFLFPLF